MDKDVFVFGIGCSGTTMTYCVLQNVFTALYGENYYSTYEPFIWEKELFNRPYENVRSLFGKTSSLSVDGIYNHLNTPLFVDDTSVESYASNDFFRHFSVSQGQGLPHLAKLIRGNGRMPVFRTLNPKARFLLMVRNPVDTINCAKHKFSFFGEDFYPSDFPRFCKQLKGENRLALDEKCAPWAKKQAEYCYQMNRAAMAFASIDRNTKILEYDSFIRKIPLSVKELCDFLEVQFTNDHVNILRQPVGPVTALQALSQEEFETILPYDDLYDELCKKAGVKRGKSKDEVIGQYDGRCSSEGFNTKYEESTTNQLRRVIRLQESQIQDLKNQLRK